MKKKLTAALLAVLFCLAFISCEKEEPVISETKELTEEEISKEETITEESVPDWDLTEDVSAWMGFADEGTLKNSGEQKVYHIKTAEDLDPFREHLNLTADEEKALFAEPKDHVLLIEFFSTTEQSDYTLDTIYWDNGDVTVEIHEDQADETTPSHTFFLFHMPVGLIGNANVNFNVFSF